MVSAAPDARSQTLRADREAIRGYLEELFGTADAGWLAIWDVETERTVWVPATDLDLAALTTERLSNAGRNVYLGMGLHPIARGSGQRGKASGVCALPGLFADVDFTTDEPAHKSTKLPSEREALELIAEMPLPPTVIVHSGHGFYPLWLFHEVETTAAGIDEDREARRLEIEATNRGWQARLKQLARQRGFDLDPTADLARVLRPAGVINRKKDCDPKPVRIVHEGGPRYALADFEPFLPDEKTVTHETTHIDKEEEERADIEEVMAGCAWLRHTRDEAASLSEPVWFAGMSIVANCRNGNDVAHDYSKPYTGYSDAETTAKAAAARKADKPIRCATIAEDYDGARFCRVCPNRGKITSPIELGYPMVTVTAKLTRVNDHSHIASTEPEWPVLPPEALDGLAGEIVALFAPHTEADPAALLTTVLAMYGNCVGRQPHLWVGESRHGTNLFAVIAGKSSRSRKGTSAAGPRRIFDLIDKHWQDNRHVDGIGSGEAVIWAVRDPSEPKTDKKGETVIEDHGVDDKRLMVFEEEFAGLLDVSGRDGSIVSAIMRKAWDGPGVLHNAVKGKPVKSTGAHVSTIGHITIDELRRKLTDTDKANGIGNRFLWVLAKRAQELPFPERVPDVEIMKLANRAKRTLEQARKGGVVVFNDDARDLWRLVYPVLTRDYPGLFGSLIARAEAQVIRLAMVYALMDGAASIGPRHLLSALAYWNYCEASAHFIFGDRTGDPVADKITGALRSAPAGLTESNLHRLFANSERAARIQAALASLLSTGRVTVTTERPDNGGRNIHRWQVVQSTGASAPSGDYLSMAREFVLNRSARGVNSVSSVNSAVNGVHDPGMATREADDDALVF